MTFHACPPLVDLASAHAAGGTLDHLASCAQCASAWQRLDNLDGAVAELAWAPPDDLQVRRVRTRLIEADHDREIREQRRRTSLRTLGFALVSAAAAATAVLWFERAPAPIASIASIAVAPRITVIGSGDALQLKITSSDAEFEVHNLSPDRHVDIHVTHGRVELQSSSATTMLGPEEHWSAPATTHALAPSPPLVPPSPPPKRPSPSPTPSPPPVPAPREVIAPPDRREPDSVVGVIGVTAPKDLAVGVAAIARVAPPDATAALPRTLHTATEPRPAIRESARDRQELKAAKEASRVERREERAQRREDRAERKADRVERRSLHGR